MFFPLTGTMLYLRHWPDSCFCYKNPSQTRICLLKHTSLNQSIMSFAFLSTAKMKTLHTRVLYPPFLTVLSISDTLHDSALMQSYTVQYLHSTVCSILCVVLSSSIAVLQAVQYVTQKQTCSRVSTLQKTNKYWDCCLKSECIHSIYSSTTTMKITFCLTQHYQTCLTFFIIR